MFCYQCEQTSKGQGCRVAGVCGKDENSATLQDLLIHALKGVSQYAHRAAQLGARDPEIDAFTIEAIFATLTNVNFDADSVAELVYKAAAVRDIARNLYQAAAAKAGQPAEDPAGPAAFQPAQDREAPPRSGPPTAHQRRLFNRRSGAQESRRAHRLRSERRCSLRLPRHDAWLQRPRQLRHHPRAAERTY